MTRQELLQAAKPILFSTQMVQAILDGRKTVTRRVVKPQPANTVDKIATERYRPLYKPGDYLYVRETWNYGLFDSSDRELDNSTWFEPMPLNYNGFMKDACHYVYKADYTPRDLVEMGIEHDDGSYRTDWRPSIHMPKEAARIFLRVTDVKLERLQDIEYTDVPREGIEPCMAEDGYPAYDPVADFAELWDSTVKPEDRDKYGWGANPYVWAISFERMEV